MHQQETILTYLIDRRLQSKNKSAVNRERFLRRYKGQIKQAVERSIKGRSITDIAGGEKVSIPAKDVSEPNFGHARGGFWVFVFFGFLVFFLCVLVFCLF